MSRSNPTENSPNPATRWYEWNGEKGLVRYYDKATKTTVEVGADFTFLLLDQLVSVGGWHKYSDVSIYSNAIKDVRAEVLVVKTKKDGIIANGLYKDIKERVQAVDGHYEAQLYIAYKQADDTLAIGCLRVKGAALHAWAEFAKAHRDTLYTKGVRINGYTEGQHGRVIYRVPIFLSVPVSDATNTAAVALDKTFQAWLKGYLGRTTTEQAEEPVNDSQEQEYDVDDVDPVAALAPVRGADARMRPSTMDISDVPF